MSEVLFVRHGQSVINLGDRVAFDNFSSPLTYRGIRDCVALQHTFRDEHGIEPPSYHEPVVTSQLVRTQQSAKFAGFRFVDVNELINESDIAHLGMTGPEVVKKHAEELWVPDETRERIVRLIDSIRTGRFPYKVIFGHGLFRAGVMLELQKEAQSDGKEFPYVFDKKRGFVRSTATIIPLEI